MAVKKTVDSTQLDSDLTTVANAIRTKSGGSSQLAFPSGFVSEIGNIPSGGEDTLEKSILGQLTDYTNENITTLPQYAFYYNSTAPTNLRLPNCTSVGLSAFRYCVVLESFFAPLAGVGSGAFYGCRNLPICVISGTTVNPATNGDVFMKYGSDMAIHTIDFSLKKNGFCKRMFYQCVNLKTLILREAAIFPVGDINAFYQTPFDSGGSGGTIYIPKALYDHLGDGTANDYKAATNWSTIDGYGTITWAKIEGSIYENAYADGTPIT